MALKFKLADIINKRSVSPEELSKTTGISLDTVLSMCDGSADGFRLKELEAICEALNCQPVEIIQDER